MTIAEPCQCGEVRDARGLCLHCDHPGPCRSGCTKCLYVSCRCPVCGVLAGTPAAALRCEKKCRATEIREHR